MAGDNASKYSIRKQRLQNIQVGAANGKIKAPTKGVNRAAGMRTDKARAFVGLGPRKGVARMQPSQGNGLRKIGPYKGPLGGSKPYSGRQKRRAIS